MANGVTFMHAGTNLVHEEQVRDLALLPAESRSYKPVPNGMLLDLIYEGAGKWLGKEPAKTQFSMNTTGSRMFGTMSFETEEKDTMLNFGFGNSYDKSMSLRLVSGAQIFICDNLCYSGDAISWVRKHTTNVLQDIREKIRSALCLAEVQYEDMMIDLSAFKEHEVKERRGAELIGLAQYGGVLTSTAANIAREDWRSPRYVDFAKGNMFSLYNCFTEGAKKGEAGNRIDRQAKIHKFFTFEIDKILKDRAPIITVN